MSLKKKRIFVAGSTGMVGSAIVRLLEAHGCSELLTTTSADLDLIDQASVREFFEEKQPEIVILAAAKVGGILANDTFRADFLFENLAIETNVIHTAFKAGVEKLIFLGSSCIYPRLADQPIIEESLLTGPLEPTNEPYAIAKIAGIKLCENYYRQHGANFYSVMPTNLYGRNDNFDLDSSHVIPALIRKFSAAKANGDPEVIVWGSGTPRREFLLVDDLADAILFLLENVEASDIYGQGISHVNIGCGEDIEIRELASMIGEIIGFSGSITYDTDKPDGTPRKLLDVSRLSGLGWTAKTPLDAGLKSTIEWFQSSENTLAKKA
ncbi:MAG: GDP-L-fucose synthase [Acidobacteria bacterium]|nr:GDP-L-fucose synthase [Acidobacteriota bacterium]